MMTIDKSSCIGIFVKVFIHIGNINWNNLIRKKIILM